MVIVVKKMAAGRFSRQMLGLSPSTAHAVLRATTKIPGSPQRSIKRMLASPNISEGARTIILEYNDEKIAGLYGHTRSQRLRFMTTLVDIKVDSSLSPAFPARAPTSMNGSSTTAA